MIFCAFFLDDFFLTTCACAFFLDDFFLDAFSVKFAISETLWKEHPEDNSDFVFEERRALLIQREWP